MHKTGLFALVALLCVPHISVAQESVLGASHVLLFPGSVNASAGTLSPAEGDNVLASITVEQGFTAWHRSGLSLVGFVDVTRRHDSQGLSWNRTTPFTGGIKLVSVTKGGVVQFVAGIAAQTMSGSWSEPSTATYVSYWNGWSAALATAHVKGLPDSFPGHVYASSGVVTAAEPGNWISTASVRQGVTVARPLGIAITPFVGASSTADTAGFQWNNRSQWDAGINLSRSVGPGVFEIGAARRHESRRVSDDARTKAVVYMNFWLGWNPHITH